MQNYLAQLLQRNLASYDAAPITKVALVASTTSRVTHVSTVIPNIELYEEV